MKFKVLLVFRFRLIGCPYTLSFQKIYNKYENIQHLDLFKKKNMQQLEKVNRLWISGSESVRCR